MRDFHDKNETFCKNCYIPPPPVVKEQSEYHRYFLTITRNREWCTEEEWLKACNLFLSSKLFKHGVYAYERGEKGTNLHCHLFAFCQSKLCHNAKDPKFPKERYKGTKHLGKFNYKYGFIHFQTVPKDNGIENYISKEAEKKYFSNVSDSLHPITHKWHPSVLSASEPDSESDPPSDADEE